MAVAQESDVFEVVGLFDMEGNAQSKSVKTAQGSAGVRTGFQKLGDLQVVGRLNVNGEFATLQAAAYWMAVK